MEGVEKAIWKMSRWKIIIEDLAQLDLHDVYQWYEEEKTGLGEEFLDSFEVSISRIERNPLHASSYDATSRSAILTRFPYEVIYLVNDLESEINIIAISYQHRKPDWFKKRR